MNTNDIFEQYNKQEVDVLIEDEDSAYFIEALLASGGCCCLDCLEGVGGCAGEAGNGVCSGCGYSCYCCTQCCCP